MTELLAHAAIQLEHERCLRFAAHPEQDTTDLFGVETLAERQRYYEFRAEALGFALDRFQRWGATLVREFQSKEWLWVPGRGWLALITLPSDDPLPETGEPVVIDGEVYTITKIETSRILTDPPRRDTNVGLRIRGEPKRKEN